MSDNICKAEVEINGAIYTCECSEGHEGPHASRVQTSEITYDGFDWDIDDRGRIVLDIPYEVLRQLTYTSRPTCARCGYRGGEHHPLCKVEGITDEALKQAMAILSQDEIPF